jgi:type IV secretion system protein VirD4
VNPWPRRAVGVLLLACVCWLWLAIASGVFLFLRGRWGHFQFPFDQWAIAAPHWHVSPTMKIHVLGSAAVPTALLVACVIRWIYYLAFLKPKQEAKKLMRPFSDGGLPVVRGPTQTFGTAEWATKGEMLAAYPGQQGMLIGATGRESSADLLIDSALDGPTHSLIFQGPGSDKSTTSVLRIYLWPGAKVVFDPSRELEPIVHRALVEDGCDVHQVQIGKPGFNVLEGININDPEAEVHIISAVGWIYDEEAAKQANPTQRDPFWSDWGKRLVACFLAHMLYSEEIGPPRTLRTLREGLKTPEGEMQAMLAVIAATSNSPMARDTASGLMDMKAAVTFSGIYSNAFAATAWLSIEAYADIVSGDAFKATDVLKGRTAIFVGLTLETMKNTPAIGRAVLGALLNPVYRADGVGVTDRVMYLIDEAWIFGAMDEIALGFVTGRKYLATFCLLYASEAKFNSVWGEDAAAMRDYCSWRCYAAIQDGEIADKLSKDMGQYSAITYAYGSNTGRSSQSGLATGSTSTGDTYNMHEVEHALLSRAQILNLRSDQIIVMARNMPPMLAYSAPYYRYPKFNALMDDNRFKRPEVLPQAV